jgi:sugar (pentulose or hexulose) kinase
LLFNNSFHLTKGEVVSKKTQDYVISIDDGTQGLVAVLMNTQARIIASGDTPVNFSVKEGNRREQSPTDWLHATSSSIFAAFADAKKKKIKLGKCLGIMPSAQMHTEGLAMDGQFIPSMRLWCDGGSKAEAEELTKLFGVHIPQRLTISRWLETIRKRPELARRVTHITTTAGVIATFFDSQATGLAMCEARGMFPIDPKTGEYDKKMVAQFDELTAQYCVKPLLELLPQPKMVGEIIGNTDVKCLDLFGLPAGIPIFSGAGDQGTTMTAAHVHQKGAASMSCGTSCCMNQITDMPFSGSFPEPFMTSDGQVFLMSHVQNFTSFFNMLMKKYGKAAGLKKFGEIFARFAPMIGQVPAGSNGLITVPFAEPEHGANLGDKAYAAVYGQTAANSNPGCELRSALEGILFSVRLGTENARTRGIELKKVIPSGGLLQTHVRIFGQVIADVFNAEVEVFRGGASGAGSAYGAGLSGLYGYLKIGQPSLKWSEFLDETRPKRGVILRPIQGNVEKYNQTFMVYKDLVEKIQPNLNKIIG